MNSIVVHYQELALKGKNRPWFLGRLVRNLRRALSDLDVRTVRALMGRVEVVLGPGAVPSEVSERISRVFGIANFSYANSTPLDYARSDDGRSDRTGPTGDLDAIASAILADLGDRTCTSFRVSARRADKRFPMTSPQIEREVGGRIKEARGWTVNLDDPELVIHVELLTNQAFYFFGKERGPGGCRRGRPAAWCVCCRAGSILPSPLTA
jgi:thiamine biosynthesis protein ThiI